jgi:hypothetical protein
MRDEMRWDEVWCGVVWCGVVWCGVVWCGVVWCGVMWCDVMWCDVMWCDVMWCDVMWCDVMRWDEMRWDEMWCDEMRWDETRRDVTWRDETRRDEMVIMQVKERGLRTKVPVTPTQEGLRTVKENVRTTGATIQRHQQYKSDALPLELTCSSARQSRCHRGKPHYIAFRSCPKTSELLLNFVKFPFLSDYEIRLYILSVETL